ncbi:MAG TPA: TolC family protein [Bacteroidales bacterium]|nr:TolC family protein [Bacteroidales bacterium]
MDNIKVKLFIIPVLLLLLTGQWLFAQGNSEELKLSLKEAQEYASQNNKMVKSAKLTVQGSQKDVWTTISSGLPQVSADATLTDNLKLGVFVMTMNDPATGVSQTMVITMGMKYSIPVTATASMPLFNAPYYVGIETVKLARKLSESGLKSTEIDTRQSVASAYYLILVSEESLRILKENISNLQETLKSTRAMYNSGLAEATDVDQMASNVTMVENSFSNLQNNIEINYNLLRLQLGVKADTKVTLTETLDDLVKEINVDALLSQEFNYTGNIQYNLVEMQEQLSALNLKSQKAKTLPSLSGFYSYSKSGMGMNFSDMEWYPSSYLGMQLSVPIFASGQRYANIQKAKIELEKARNTKEMVSDQLNMQDKQLRYNLENANLQYKSQKDNVEVSKRVYSSMENKYKQGMASSLDLTQANNLYLQAENNYISSLLNLLQTKLEFDKLLNNM